MLYLKGAAIRAFRFLVGLARSFPFVRAGQYLGEGVALDMRGAATILFLQTVVP